MDAEQCIKRLEQLKAERSTWESHWQDIVDYVVPSRGDFVRATQTKGDKRGIQVYDATATNSLIMFAAGLQGFLTSPGQRWFQLSTSDPRQMRNVDVRNWLQMVSEDIYDTLARPMSKFYPQSHELYLDLGSFGTGVQMAQEEIGVGIMFRTFHLSSSFIDIDHIGDVDTLYRCFKYNPRQVLEMWGQEKTPPKIYEMYTEGKNTEIEIVHSVYPRAAYDPGKDDKYNMPWASKYIWMQGKETIDEGGYREFPYLVPRWYVMSGETYGRSPAMDCLPDIKMLNAMAKTTIKGAQKTVDPPLQGPDDGFMAEIDLSPGAMNYYRAGTVDRIEPIRLEGRPEVGLEMQEQRRQTIRQAFFNDQLRETKNAEMSATESIQNKDDRMQMMSPQLGRMHPEYLGRVITRVYNLRRQSGELPPPPAQLRGADIKINYISPLAKAQKRVRAFELMSMMQSLAPFAEIKPEVLDYFDADGLAQFFSEVYDAPSQVIASEEKVAALREQRAQQMEQAHAVQMAEQGSKAMANVMKAKQGNQ